jgi:hypothetical protein
MRCPRIRKSPDIALQDRVHLVFVFAIRSPSHRPVRRQGSADSDRALERAACSSAVSTAPSRRRPSSPLRSPGLRGRERESSRGDPVSRRPRLGRLRRAARIARSLAWRRRSDPQQAVEDLSEKSARRLLATAESANRLRRRLLQCRWSSSPALARDEAAPAAQMQSSRVDSARAFVFGVAPLAKTSDYQLAAARRGSHTCAGPPLLLVARSRRHPRRRPTHALWIAGFARWMSASARRDRSVPRASRRTSLAVGPANRRTSSSNR